MKIAIFRRTAAHIAAAAVYELYPDIELLGGEETSTGFFYNFYFPHPVHSNVIEEKMRQVVREQRSIRTHEMVPLSAKELLKSRGLYARAEEIEEGGLVELIQIGDFFDLSLGSHLKNTAELKAFKIEAKPSKEKQMRLTGWCHRSQAELKAFLKKLKNYVEPEVMGQKLGFWTGEMFLPKGIEIREKLIQFFKKEWFNGCFEVLGRGDFEKISLHRSTAKSQVAEVWSEVSGVAKLQISFFDKAEEELNSCLQMIAKTLTILGFDHSQVQHGLQVDFVVEDALERSHSIVQVTRLPQKRGVSRIDFKIFAVIEEVLAQMIEKNLIERSLENK